MDEDRGIIRRQRVYRKLLMAMGVYKTEDTEEDFLSFKEYFESHKYFDTGVQYSYDDNYLTLMTCEYTNKNGRFFVLSKQIKTETNHY